MSNLPKKWHNFSNWGPPAYKNHYLISAHLHNQTGTRIFWLQFLVSLRVLSIRLPLTKKIKALMTRLMLDLFHGNKIIKAWFFSIWKDGHQDLALGKRLIIKVIRKWPTLLIVPLRSIWNIRPWTLQWPVPRPDEQGQGLGMWPPTPPHKKASYKNQYKGLLIQENYWADFTTY